MTTTASNKKTTRSINVDKTFWRRVRVIAWSVAALIMIAPLVAMQFTKEVDWGVEDFLFAALLLGGTGLLFEFMVRRSNDPAYRLGVLIALTAAFLLAWINAAVGLVGGGANIANSLYFAVLAIMVVGCYVAGFQATGLTRTMFATAAAQILVTLLVVVLGWGSGEDGSLMIIAINTLFIALWAASALFFQRAAMRHSI